VSQFRAAGGIQYGKGNVTVYRTYARPLVAARRIPESSFTGRPNILFAVDVDVHVYGDSFLPAYTEGDNSGVVATDSMKNFIHAQALAYDGATLEGFLAFLGARFLETYPSMEWMRVEGREEPFVPVSVPLTSGTFDESGVLFARRHQDHATARLDISRDGLYTVVGALVYGHVGLELIKVTGSSFFRFMRDEHTTLPERVDRPLFIYLDIHWTYHDFDEALRPDSGSYVPAEQIRDVAQVVFHDFNSKSIQHLVHEMGTMILERFPQLASVSFDAQNRLWDTGVVSEVDEKVKVYCDPRPPYGMIHLTLRRDDTGTATA
jgi:urate oxidase